MSFLDAVASPSTYPCQWVGQWVSEWFIVSDCTCSWWWWWWWCTCSWWWFLRNLTRLVARGGKSALIFKLLTVRPNLGSKLQMEWSDPNFFGRKIQLGKFPHFIGWNGGGALEQVALNVNQSSLSPNSMDCSNLFDLVQIEVHPKLVGFLHC